MATSDFISLKAILAPDLESISLFLTSVAQRQREEDLIGHRGNDNESDQTDEEIANTRFVVSMEDEGTVKGDIVTSGSLWDTDMDEGHSAPFIGGRNGIVTYPDGHTESSDVARQLQQTVRIDDFAEVGSSVWRENTMKIAATLLPEEIANLIQARTPEIAEAYATARINGSGS